MKWNVGLLAALFLGLLVQQLQANGLPIDGEIINFDSDEHPSKFWVKKNPDKVFVPTQIKAKIYIPDGAGDFPAVILLHGCGNHSNIDRWGNWYKNQGYVALAPVSFGPIDYGENCLIQDRFGQAPRKSDAFGALTYLASLPFVKRHEVIAMGFSHGAGTAMLANSLNEKPRSDKLGLKFQAVVALYPDCALHEPPYMVPVFLAIGVLDDWALATSCAGFPALSGKEVIVLKLYADAHHYFDHAIAEKRFIANAMNLYAPNGRGATIKENAAAVEQLKLDIKEFLHDLQK